MESLERNVAYLEFYEVTSAIRSAMRYEVFEIGNARWKGSGVFGAKTDCNNQAD